MMNENSRHLGDLFQEFNQSLQGIRDHFVTLNSSSATFNQVLADIAKRAAILVGDAHKITESLEALMKFSEVINEIKIDLETEYKNFNAQREDIQTRVQQGVSLLENDENLNLREDPFKVITETNAILINSTRLAMSVFDLENLEALLSSEEDAYLIEKIYDEWGKWFENLTDYYIRAMQLSKMVITKVQDDDTACKLLGYNEMITSSCEKLLTEIANNPIGESKKDDSPQDAKILSLININESVLKEQVESTEEVLAKINNLIGLKNFKNFILFETDESEINNNSDSSSKTFPKLFFFKGNPGTNKALAARLLGSFYKSTGFLRKGHLILAHKSDLISEYIGLTEIKIMDLIQKANEGVLFIDEIHTLCTEKIGAFEEEALNTIITKVLDNNSSFIVVFAGYSTFIEDFFNQCPRIEGHMTIIKFPDFSAAELFEFVERYVAKDKFSISPILKAKIIDYYSYQIKINTQFGNAQSAILLSEELVNNYFSILCKYNTRDDRILREEHMTSITNNHFRVSDLN